MQRSIDRDGFWREPDRVERCQICRCLLRDAWSAPAAWRHLVTIGSRPALVHTCSSAYCRDAADKLDDRHHSTSNDVAAWLAGRPADDRVAVRLMLTHAAYMRSGTDELAGYHT